MNQFLTEKATKKRIWEIPVIIVCLFFLIIWITILVDQFRDKDISLAIASVLFGAINIFVIYRILTHRLLQLKAQRFAGALSDCPKESLSLDDFGDLVAEKNVEKTLFLLQNGGYLRNVSCNRATHVLSLNAIDQRVANAEYVMVECPNCGAKSRVLKGRIGRCPYCDQELE